MKNSLALLLLTTLVGCSGAEVKRVTGAVYVDGRPGEEICVTFWPKTDLYLGMMTAYQLDEDGVFDIVPKEEQGQGKAGTYNVLIQDTRNWKMISSLGSYEAGKGLAAPAKVNRGCLPKVYADREATPLCVEIVKGVNELDPFEIESIPDAPPKWISSMAR